MSAPNTLKAITYLLRGNATAIDPYRVALLTDLHALVPDTRIDEVWSDSWVNAGTGRIQNAITVTRLPGIGPDTGPRSLPYRAQASVMIRCWSSFFHTANEIAWLVSRLLLPDQPGIGGWEAAGTRVLGVTGVTDPAEYQEPDTTWQRAMQMQASLYYQRAAASAA